MVSMCTSALAGPVQAWSRYLNSGVNDYFGSSALDGLGNTYLVGTRSTGAVADIFLAKYSPAGALIWTRTYNGPENKSDQGLGLTVDAAGDVWVCGSVGASNMTDAVVLKYSAAGALLFSRFYAQAHPSSEAFNTVQTDAAGDAYVAGTVYKSGSATAQDVIVRKYSKTGLIRWTRIYTSAGANSDGLVAMKLDPSGNPFVGVNSNTSPQKSNILKLNAATGAIVFNKAHGTTTVNTTLANIALDTMGNVLGAFTEQFGETGRRVTFIKYAGASGAVLMTPKYYNQPGPAPDFYTCWNVAIDSTGAFYAIPGGGAWELNGFKWRFPLVKFSSAGVKLWEREMVTKTQGGFDCRLIVDAAGNAYVTTVQGSPKYIILWKYTTAGLKLYSFLPTRPSPRMPTAVCLMRHLNGDLYLAGTENLTATDYKTDFVLFKFTGG